MFPLPFRSWDCYGKLAVRDERRAHNLPRLSIYTTLPRRICKSRNGTFAVMGMKSDRNMLSTMDLKFLENSWNDVVWRTAIPAEFHEAIAVIQDAQVRGYCQILGGSQPLHAASLSARISALARKDEHADRLPGKEPGPPFIALRRPERASASKPLLSPQGGGLLEQRARDARVPASEQRPSMPGKTGSLSLGRGLG